jgi:hypothetical protein
MSSRRLKGQIVNRGSQNSEGIDPHVSREALILNDEQEI